MRIVVNKCASLALTRNQMEHFLRQMEVRGLDVKKLPTTE